MQLKQQQQQQQQQKKTPFSEQHSLKTKFSQTHGNVSTGMTSLATKSVADCLLVSSVAKLCE